MASCPKGARLPLAALRRVILTEMSGDKRLNLRPDRRSMIGRVVRPAYWLSYGSTSTRAAGARLDASNLGECWEAEIKRRIDDVDGGRVKTVPADEAPHRAVLSVASRHLRFTAGRGRAAGHSRVVRRTITWSWDFGDYSDSRLPVSAIPPR